MTGRHVDPWAPLARRWEEARSWWRQGSPLTERRRRVRRQAQGLTQRDVAIRMLQRRIDVAYAAENLPLKRPTGRVRSFLHLPKRRADAGVSSVFPFWVLGSMITAFVCCLLGLRLLDADRRVALVVLCSVPYLIVIVGLLRANLLSRRRHRAQAAARYENEISAMPHDGAIALQRAENLLARSSAGEVLLTQRLMQNGFMASLFAVPIAGFAAYATLPHAHTSVIVGACCFGALMLGGLIVTRQRVADAYGQIRQSDYERSLLLEHATAQERAEKLFLRQQFEVKRYYDETLRQSSILSYIGILCIAGGFAVIGAAFALVVSAPEHTTQQVIIAALGAAGGLLANFVAVVFLRMHAGTVRALTSFHERLVSTHHVHFGNLLASRLPDSRRERLVIGEMAVQLSRAAAPDVAGPVDDGHERGTRKARRWRERL